MGERSRARRARRAWIVTLLVPVLHVIARRVRRLRPLRAYRLGVLLGALFDRVGLTRDIVRNNLKIACGGLPARDELRRFEQAYFRHFGLLVVDFLRQPLVTPDGWRESIAGDGIDRVQEVLAEGNGVICVAGHAGLWELAGHAGACSGVPLTSVAKLSDHPGLDAFVLGIRGAAGQRVIDVRGSMWPMKKALDRGEAVGINIDQEARQDPVFAPFFGVPAATSAAPALLHRRTGAPIVVITVHRTGPSRWEATAFDVIRHAKTDDQAADVLAVTARINKAMEAAIRRHPEQWLWSHRRWRRRPDGEAAPLARVDATPPLDVRGSA